MSGVGGGSSGGGGGAAGAGNDVAQELAEVRAKIEKLEKAIEEQQRELKAAGWTFERIADNAQLAADKQRLVELQKEKNRLAEQQQREQQQQQRSQAGSAGFEVFLISADIVAKEEGSSFRQQLAYALRRKGAHPYGECSRSGVNICVRFIVSKAELKERAIVLEAVRETARKLAFALVTPVEHIMKQAEDVHIEAMKEPGKAWEYEPQQTSPRAGVLSRKRYAEEVEEVKAPDWFSTKKPKSEGSSGQQKALVLFDQKYMSEMEWLLRDVLAAEGWQATLQELLALKFPLDYQTHQNYDNLLFCFAWRFVKEPGGQGWTLCLSPRVVEESFMGELSSLDMPSVIHVPGIQQRDKPVWKRALVLRKYLTIAVHTKHVPKDDMLAEWNTADDTSPCWKQEALAE